MAHPTDRLGGLVQPSFLSGRLAPTYPIEITRVVSPTYDKWDEPPSKDHEFSMYPLVNCYSLRTGQSPYF